MCPECFSQSLNPQPYSFGRCPDTGYEDAGVHCVCNDCGYEDDAEVFYPKKTE